MKPEGLGSARCQRNARWVTKHISSNFDEILICFRWDDDSHLSDICISRRRLQWNSKIFCIKISSYVIYLSFIWKRRRDMQMSNKWKLSSHRKQIKISSKFDEICLITHFALRWHLAFRKLLEIKRTKLLNFSFDFLHFFYFIIIIIITTMKRWLFFQRRRTRRLVILQLLKYWWQY